MAHFSIGEVEKLTGIKQHILRYWESVIPMLRPQKDDQGRRVYTQRDVDLIFRLQYLIEQKKFTVEGAGDQIIAESVQRNQQAESSCISIVRGELLNIYAIIQERKNAEEE